MTDAVVDIETVGQPLENFTKSQLEYLETHEDHGEPMVNRLALYGWTCEIAAVAILNPASNRGRVIYRTRRSPPEGLLPQGWEAVPVPLDGEQALLIHTWEILSKFDRLITYNGRGFDLPVLAQRSLTWSVRVPIHPAPYRYSCREHLDLAEVLSGFGATRKFPLGFLCDAMKLPNPKTEMSGKDVETRWLAGQYEDIARYVVQDVISESALFSWVQTFLDVMLTK